MFHVKRKGKMVTEVGGMQVSVEQDDGVTAGFVMWVDAESLAKLRQEVASGGFLTPADWQPVLEAIGRQLTALLVTRYDPAIHTGQGYIQVGLALKPPAPLFGEPGPAVKRWG